MDGGLVQTIVIIGLLVAVLLSAYYVTKFLAKRGRRLTQSKHIKVIDQIYLSTDKQIALIKVGNKSVLVGITNQNINLIAKMDEDTEEEILKAEAEDAANRKDVLSKAQSFIKKAWGSQEEFRASREKYKRETKKKDAFASVMEAAKNKEEENNSLEDGSMDEN